VQILTGHARPRELRIGSPACGIIVGSGCGAAVAARSVVNIGNVREDPRWLTTFGTTCSEIIAPVLSDGARVVGLIDAESNQLNAFGAEDERFLEQCAARMTQLFLRPNHA